MRRKALALMMAFLFSAVAGTVFVNLSSANPLPPVDPAITIDSPQNATYRVNTIILSFTIESNWGVYPCFYSLDGQKMKPIENLTVISREDANIGKNPPIYRTTLEGNCVLSNLSQGEHNVTFYLITDHEFSLYRTYEKGDVLYSATAQFIIDSSRSFPTVFAVGASGASVAILGIGILTYFKKHRAKSEDE